MSPNSDTNVWSWRGSKKSLFTAAGGSFLMLQLLFLGNMSLLYGSQYGSENRVHALNVLAVDYDGGIIGQSMFGAYSALKGPSFPSLQIHSTSEYPTIESLTTAIRHGDFWAAVFSSAGASDRLAAALQGGQAATDYNATDTITYIWNEARYPTTEEGDIEAKLEELIGVARVVYNQINGTRVLPTLDTTDVAVVAAFLNPISVSDINLRPTAIGTRVLYNTASVALSIIQQFFFIMAINGISGGLKLFSKLGVVKNGFIRMGFGTTYTFIGSLCWAGYLYGFKATWALSGGQFMLIWMLNWLFMYINFLVLDVAATFIPMMFLPFFVLTWVIVNIASSLANFPLSPGFYRYGYGFPGRNWYTTFITIVSGGMDNRLYQTLPILFSWLVLFQVIIVFAMFRRCRKARELEAKELEAEIESHTRIARKYNASIAQKSEHGDGSLGRTGSTNSDPLVELATEASQVYSPRVPMSFRR